MTPIDVILWAVAVLVVVIVITLMAALAIAVVRTARKPQASGLRIVEKDEQ